MMCGTAELLSCSVPLYHLCLVINLLLTCIILNWKVIKEAIKKLQGATQMQKVWLFEITI